MSEKTCRLLAAAALLSCAPGLRAQSRPAVVELYTSEGCSSCPPAEAYVGVLARRPDVLALTFHVDYWDGLGWRDRFAIHDAVQRQRGYAAALGLSSVYTPQAVVDGRENFVGSDRSAIERSLARGRRSVPLAVAVHDGDVWVDVGAAQSSPPADVLLLAYLRTATSSIDHGENSGRTVAEFNVVRSMRYLGRWDGAKRQFHARVDSLPADATDVAVLVQQPDQAQIIGAAAAALR